MLLLRLTSRSGQEYCIRSALARETGVKNQGMMGGAGNMAEMMNMIRQKVNSRFSTLRCETSAVVARRPGSARSELLWCTLPFLETKRRRTGVNLVSRSQTSRRGTSQAAHQGTQPGIATNRA